MRSRTGCQTCRQRKLKCDEVKPECGQCRKAKKECRPSDGVVFRHQQNASMNSGEGAGDNGERLGSFFSYRNTFDENNVWVPVPKNVTFHHITDPYNMEPSPEPEAPSAARPRPDPRTVEKPAEQYQSTLFERASGLEALSAAATNNRPYNRTFSHPAPSPGPASTQHSNNLNFILNPTGPSSMSPPIDPALTGSPHSFPFPRAQQEINTVSDREIAFLLRHFSETTGQWMDLFDLGCFFAHQVPVLSMSNALLRYSACAYAAKQLGQVRGKKTIMGGNAARQADMELYPESADWSKIGAKYYGLALPLLMAEVENSHKSETPITPLTEETYSPRGNAVSPQSLSSHPSQRNKRRRQSRAPYHNADETLAATAILCVYEFLDNANSAWSYHLTGTKNLFDLVEKEGMMPLRSPTSPGVNVERSRPSRARIATFWNFARQDFLAAFINEGQTRLNTEDWTLWRAAGLLIDDQGFIVPSNRDDTSLPCMREDMISNALVWLMSKIVNYLASGDSVDHVYPQDSSSPNGVIGINQMTLLERWRELEKELDAWYQGLPDSFKPCVRLAPISHGSIPSESARAIFPEIWYSMSMCASTMQSYHFARIILLINRPHESTARRSTVSDRLQSYRSIEAEVRHHSHEICGIALGRPEGSVRIHQTQALFVAGQCLTETRERNVVVELLRGIESDLGWATDFRVQKLLREWNWAQ